ncbi:hypothetical protein LJR130_003823 [Variovorax sp. LjRoot130]|uniref:hypothetical protein n=1 Tax=Variovorax sp. LjRoot130 TaxID=3342261 RepID=UPI003ECFB7CB
MAIPFRRIPRGARARAAGSVPTTGPCAALVSTEDELLAIDRAVNEAKNNGIHDRVCTDAAMRLDAQHGIGLL